MPTDVTKPVLTGLGLPKVLDASTPGTFFRTTFQVAATDVGAGVGRAVITLDRPFLYDGPRDTVLISDTWNPFADDGRSSTEVGMISATTPGVYTVKNVQLFDKAGNVSTYTTADLQALGFRTSFEVRGTPWPDAPVPELKSLTFPTTIDMSGGDARALFTATVGTTGAGVQAINISFDVFRQFDTTSGPRATVSLTDAFDSFADGTSSTQMLFRSSTPPGAYNIRGVTVFDQAGYQRSYTAAQLQTMGIATTINVVASSAPTPKLTALTLPPGVTMETGVKYDGHLTPISLSVGVQPSGVAIDKVALYLRSTLHLDTGTTSYIEFNDATDSFADGKSSVRLTLAPGTTDDSIYIGELVITDKNGRATSYSADQMFAQGYTPYFYVTSTSTNSVWDFNVGLGDPAWSYQNIARTAAPPNFANDERLFGDHSTADKVRALASYAQGTTSVAALTYQFFTGGTPSQAGLDYLVSPTGPNPNNLNSAYYQGFNLENRFINFAANLALNEEGKAAFAASYAGMSFAQAVDAIYDKVIGKTSAAKAGVDVAAAVAYITGQQPYFAAVAHERMPDQDQAMAMKAGLAGYIMAEAVKADIGAYAHALDNFYLDLTDGTAQFAIDLLGVYGAGKAGDIFGLA